MKSLALLTLFSAILLSHTMEQSPPWNADGATSIIEVEIAVGMPVPSHYRLEADSADVEKGRQLVHDGRVMTADFKSDYISKFYQCTHCHNTVREEPDLSVVDTEARLNHAIANELPYLQGSTFWGMVDRREWYNDDYIKKYGDLVLAANNSLEASVQLCAQECSQGRVLEDWEMEAILAYLTTLRLDLDDMGFSKETWAELDENMEPSRLLELIDAHYLRRSPATFVDPPADYAKGYGLEGDPTRGESIYTLACGHCHREGGVSDLVLDESRHAFNWLEKNITKHHRYSIYEAVRKGTYAESGHREYMPHYTAEKMSDQQVEDLRAYIEQESR